MSDTPRTDEQCTNSDPWHLFGAMMIHFSRQLERELTAEKARAEKWKACATNLREAIELWDTEMYNDAIDAFDALMKEES